MSRKILLADDSVTAQNMGRRILSEAGYEVVTVNNGPAALKKLAEMEPDLVILDIYMPGYGGIEVCQRIKEAPETSSIPVLLTVGKLEPFKADEARRVKADAHLIKPFEATELLAALTKLEDKLVPRPAAAPSVSAKNTKKAGNAAPPAAKEKKFGDSSNGWKQRLTIPPPEVAKPEPEVKETSSTAFRTIVRKEEPETAPVEAHDEGGLTADITAEEIAAITAAAAAFDQANGSGEIDHSGSVTEEEIAAVVAAAPPPTSIEEPAPPVAEVAPEPNFAAVSVAADIPVPVELPTPVEEQVEAAPAITPSVEPEVEHFHPSEKRPSYAPSADAELNAMLDSLAPVGASLPGARENGQFFGAAGDVVEATLAQVGSRLQNGGARWVAEEIALLTDESSLNLEDEMQRAYVAFAEAAAAAQAHEAQAEDTVPSFISDVEATIAANQNVADVAAQEEVHAEAASKPAVDAVSTEPAQPSQAEEFAEPASVEPIAAVATNEVTAEVPQESAYAAAASTGTEFHSIQHMEAPATEPVEQAAAAPAIPTEHEAELAAAWAHWRQIRETVASPKFASQLAEAAAAGYKEVHKPEAAAPSPDAASVAADPAAIASIVDSVLAELKPKLVAEIARKLGEKK